MHHPIELIVGLGNPGPEYEHTRHNAGAWFVQQLATRFNINLRMEKKFSGLYASIDTDAHSCRLLIPSTFMNLSGQSVSALTSFYKIPAHAILVAHDELDFPPGIARLKYAGGHGGHKGISDIIRHVNTPNFYRLRLGIGHPGDRSQVSNYVLSRPSTSEREGIQSSIDQTMAVINDLLEGKIFHATQYLHQNLV